MNRQLKRAMERQRQRQVEKPAPARRPMPERRKRATPREFLREVRQELRKVNWPTRREMATYTVVVLVTVSVLTAFVFGLDWVFARGVLRVLGGN